MTAQMREARCAMYGGDSMASAVIEAADGQMCIDPLPALCGGSVLKEAESDGAACLSKSCGDGLFCAVECFDGVGCR